MLLPLLLGTFSVAAAQNAVMPEEPHLEHVVYFNKDFRYDDEIHRVFVFQGTEPSYYLFHPAKYTGLSLGNDLPSATNSAKSRLVVIDGGRFDFSKSKDYFPGEAQPRLVTMFRHPTQQVLTSYALCKYGAYAVQRGTADQVKRLREYLQFFDNQAGEPDENKKAPYNCFNPVNSQFRGMDGHHASELFVFGIQEHYRESMCLIHHAVTSEIAPFCRCGSPSPFLKRSQRVPPLSPSVEDMKVIGRLTMKDRKLYREARAIFTSRVRELEQVNGIQIFCPRRNGSAEMVWNSPADRIRLLDVPASIKQKPEIGVYLDHGGNMWHEDVFYSAADLAYRMLQRPPNLLFLIDETFAEANNGQFEDFLVKYSSLGSIPNFRYRLVKAAADTNRPTYSMCSDFDEIKKNLGYDYRFVVTTSLDDNDYRDDEAKWVQCMKKYKNSEFDFFIAHNVRKGGIDTNMIRDDWNNYIVVSNIAAHGGKYSYLPSAIPVPQQLPDCSQPPVFLIHGRLSKKYLPELETILTHEPKFNVTIRAMSNVEYVFDKKKGHHVKRELPGFLNDPRMELRQGNAMIPFEESHIGAAFIMPLLTPAHDKVGYFTGQTTSSIAFGFHFRLRFVAHEALGRMYEADLAPLDKHFLHDGSPKDVVRNFERAVYTFQEWCSKPPSKKSQWWKG